MHGHRVRYDAWYTCGQHLPSLVIWINLYHKCIFYHPAPRFVGLYMALFRSLCVLLTSPEGVFQCDHTDWCHPHRECVGTALWLRELWEHFQPFHFPWCFLLFQREKFELTYFIWLSDRKLPSSLDFRCCLLVSNISLCQSVGTLH